MAPVFRDKTDENHRQLHFQMAILFSDQDAEPFNISKLAPIDDRTLPAQH